MTKSIVVQCLQNEHFPDVRKVMLQNPKYKSL